MTYSQHLTGMINLKGHPLVACRLHDIGAGIVMLCISGSCLLLVQRASDDVNSRPL